MITFLLYNSGLELLNSLPEKLLKHPAIKNDLRKRKKKPSEVLLDLAVHQSAFDSKDKLNRGRPDIVHQVLLQYLFSPLIHPSGNNQNSNLHLLIHTSSNKYFEIPSSWRPPLHYLRFRGLLEKLLHKRSLVVSEEDSITLELGTVKQIIQKVKPSSIINFTSHTASEPLSLHAFANFLTDHYKSPKMVLCLIGGYQHGKIPDSILKQLKESKVKIHDVSLEGGRLPSWKVLSTSLQGIEWNLSRIDD